MARLLQCMTCMSLEKLPDYDGNDPEGDWALKYALRPHRFPDGQAHIGNLFKGIPEKALENMAAREEIEREIWQAKAEMASFKDTFIDDAGACFNRHGRPKLGCIDYCSSEKRLSNTNDTATAYAKSDPKKAVYLCHFCPVHSYVTSQIMDRRLWIKERRTPRRKARVRRR